MTGPKLVHEGNIVNNADSVLAANIERKRMPEGSVPCAKNIRSIALSNSAKAPTICIIIRIANKNSTWRFVTRTPLRSDAKEHVPRAIGGFRSAKIRQIGAEFN